MVKAIRDVGREILDGILELKRGETGRVTKVAAIARIREGTGLPAIHPGEFLAETLRDLEISCTGFARAISVSPTRVSNVLKGKRPVTAELALLFGRALAQSPRYWLNLQAEYDLKTAQLRIGSRLTAVRRLT
jgi:antitoxin HigA-1